MDMQTLIGKPIGELSPKELAELQSNLANLTSGLAARHEEIKAQSTQAAFAAIATIAKTQMINTLGWQKLPPLHLVGQDDGTYKVDYVVTSKSGRKSGNGKTDLGTNGGKITVSKIAQVLGGISSYKLEDGREFATIREAVVDGLGYPKPGQDVTVYSMSDVLTSKHPKTMLVLANGQEITIGEAVIKMRAARDAVKNPQVQPTPEDKPNPVPEDKPNPVPTTELKNKPVVSTTKQNK